MRPIFVLFALLLLLPAATASWGQSDAEPVELHVPVPVGWTSVDQEYRYDRDNLWEYINGAAELFLTYRFRELVVADFEQGDLALTVSVYDMGRALDAFGVFETEKPAKADRVEGVGLAAVLQPPYQGLLLKDKFYVKVEAGGGDISAETLQAAMSDIADSLQGSNELPPQLEALPETGRVPGTVAFTGGNFLGLDDLGNCLHADYKLADGTEYKLFVMTPRQAFLNNESGRWTKADHAAGHLIYRQIPYTGAVVLLGDETRLIGVSGLVDVGKSTELLESLR
ncbi:MAG: hypothetical protein KOO60_10195 [Gemmatimonadales bacterium]|nr:hypothetical protein [Gemmatimonadales bacterium]